LSAIALDGRPLPFIARLEGQLQPRHRLDPLRRDRDRHLGGLVLDRVEPVGIRAAPPRVGCASAARAPAGNATGMLGIHSQRQAIQKRRRSEPAR